MLQFLPYFCSFSLHAPPTVLVHFLLTLCMPVQVKNFNPRTVLLIFNDQGPIGNCRMERKIGDDGNQMMSKKLGIFMRKFLFRILSMGAIPNHIAFILDGNRRYAKKNNLVPEGAGHRAGFLALTSILKYCSELSVKYVAIYAISIDNFKRRKNEVQFLMIQFWKRWSFCLRKIVQLTYGLRVCFIGNFKLLNKPMRVAAEKLMRATANNTKTVILIYVAYTSSNEIVHAVEESCIEKMENHSKAFKQSSTHNDVTEGVDEHKNKDIATIKLVDLKKHMYMGVEPDPDIIIRTSGENRLSNFLLWQTNNCLLYAPAALWPEIGLWQLVWAVLK